jgi:Glutathione S-transferase, C-terminal domain
MMRIMDKAVAGLTMLQDEKKSFLQRLHPDSIVRVHCGDDGLTPPRFVTGYWSIRGLGAPIRMLLASTKIPHWVLLYDAVETDDGTEGWDKSSWMADKSWLSNECTPMINLPYLIDFESSSDAKTPPFVISHSNAILLFLDRVLISQFYPNNESTISTSLVEQLLFEIMDLRDAMVRFAYQMPADDATVKAEGGNLMEHRARPLLQHLEKYMESKMDGNTVTDDMCHLIQGRPSAPDFHLFEMLDQFHGLCSKVLGDNQSLLGLPEDSSSSGTTNVSFPRLGQFWRSFRNHATHSSYFASVLYQLPYNNPYARFGSDPTSARPYVRKQAAPWRNLGVVDIP